MAYTENGAVSLESTNDARLDLFFKTVRDLAQLPNGWHYDISNRGRLFDLIDASWAVDPLDTLKIIFNWRDCRQGKGDHAGPLMALTYIAHTHCEWFNENFGHIPEYGSYLDWVKLWQFIDDQDVKDAIMRDIVKTIESDVRKLQNDKGTGVSLLAKWVPTENGKWDRWREGSTEPRFMITMARAILGLPTSVKVLGDHLKKVRQYFISPLRKHINIVETHLTEKNYTKIDYSKVPSLAMDRYKNAFRKNDPERFAAFVDALKQGKTKINAQQVYPHDLVRQYMNMLYAHQADDVIEQQWTAIKAKVQETKAFADSIVVCDVSGSMGGTPIEVAIALGLLSISSDNQHLITFHSNPTLHKVIGATLLEQTRDVQRMDWGGNTDFSRVMELVLGMSVNKTYKRIFVFSDMQFDAAFPNANLTHFESMKAKFANIGKEMPTIIFWNLRANTHDFPVSKDERGVIMLSGYSPSLLTKIVNGNTDDITPLGVMLDIIRAPRYDRITAPVKAQTLT